MSEKKDLRSLTYERLAEVMAQMGEKSYRARQVFDWLHNKKISDISLMTNLSGDLRKRLAEDFDIRNVSAVKVLESAEDGTRKYLHGLYDGNVIETVLLRYDYGNSVCISSQVGCRMGCSFCASTIDGLARNLSAGEMAAQIYSVENDIKERVGHVVIMGSGEPLDNFDNFTDFVDIMTDPRKDAVSARNITVSTCGIVPKIRELADRKYAITLALSLHAVTNEKRRQLMPVTNKYPLEEVVDACLYYYETTGRRVTLEYSLIKGVNDTSADVNGLTAIASHLRAHVNLIPVNPVKERKYAPTGFKDALSFKNKLEKNNINVTIRREMGRDISGACGQLRRSFISKQDTGVSNA